MRARVACLLLLVAGLLPAATAACGESSPEGPARAIDVGGERVPVSLLEDAAAGLCTARDQARADVKAAEATFYDRSHGALHTISRALEPVDRAQAGRLLEDKQRVEADFEAGRPAGEVAADLDRLAQVTRAGLAILAVTVPECPDTGP